MDSERERRMAVLGPHMFDGVPLARAAAGCWGTSTATHVKRTEPWTGRIVAVVTPSISTATTGTHRSSGTATRAPGTLCKLISPGPAAGDHPPRAGRQRLPDPDIRRLWRCGCRRWISH